MLGWVVRGLDRPFSIGVACGDACVCCRSLRDQLREVVEDSEVQLIHWSGSSGTAFAVQCDVLLLLNRATHVWSSANIQAVRATGFEGGVVVLGRTDSDGAVALLEAGADDCLSYALDRPHLAARLRAVARRATGWRPQQPNDVCGVALRDDAHSVMIAGEEFQLTATPFLFLSYLMQRSDQWVRSSTLRASGIVGHFGEAASNVRWHIHNARIALGPTWGYTIHSHRGLGYMFSVRHCGKPHCAQPQRRSSGVLRLGERASSRD